MTTPPLKRRTKRTWGYRPHGIEGTWAPFNESNTRPIAVIGGDPDDSRFVELVDRLNGTADASSVVNYIETTAVAQRDRLAELEHLRNRASGLSFLLGETTARRDIFDRYPQERIGCEVISPREGLSRFNVDLAHLRRLANGIAEAYERLRKNPDRGGKPGLHLLRQTCLDLARVFEWWARTPFTFDRHPGAEGRTEFITDGARFVAVAVRVITADVTDANLVTVLPDVGRHAKETRGEQFEPTPEQEAAAGAEVEALLRGEDLAIAAMHEAAARDHAEQARELRARWPDHSTKDETPTTH